MLTDYFQRGEMRDPNGRVRHIILSEEGFTSDSATRGKVYDIQAAAYAYAYYLVDANPYIDAFILNRQVDAVIELRDGRWAAVEIKLGDSGIDEGARNLNRLSAKLKRDAEREADRKGSPSGKRKNPPSFRMVLTGSGYAYTREDGVIVVPIGCLGP